MSRQDEIVQSAQKCAIEYGGGNLVELAFKKGAEWADSHNSIITALEYDIERLKAKLQAMEDYATVTTAYAEQQSKYSQSPWISVEDRLPEKSDWVVVKLKSELNNAKWWYRGFFSGEFVWYYVTLQGEILQTDEVTHWMPIPELTTTK